MYKGGVCARCYYRTEAALVSLERSGMVLKDNVWQTKTLVPKQCKSTSVGYLRHVLHVVQRNTLVAIENLWDGMRWVVMIQSEACNVKVIWTRAGETFLCDIFDIWQRLGSCKANRSSFSQILPVDSCIFDDQLDTRDCQGRSGPFVTLRQLKPSLALQLLTYHIVYFHHFDDGGFPENQIFSEFSFIFLNRVCLFPDNQNS